jgi:hypothetical protein
MGTPGLSRNDFFCKPSAGLSIALRSPFRSAGVLDSPSRDFCFANVRLFGLVGVDCLLFARCSDLASTESEVRGLEEEMELAAVESSFSKLLSSTSFCFFLIGEGEGDRELLIHDFLAKLAKVPDLAFSGDEVVKGVKTGTTGILIGEVIPSGPAPLTGEPVTFDIHDFDLSARDLRRPSLGRSKATGGYSDLSFRTPSDDGIIFGEVSMRLPRLGAYDVVSNEGIWV